ncbi:zinc knuckle CX2CX4HX4C containing protein [Tanacetum coccineum]
MTNIVPAPPTDPPNALDGSKGWGILKNGRIQLINELRLKMVLLGLVYNLEVVQSDPIVQSVDINKSTSYAGVAGGSAKDQPNVNSNFRTLVADPIFDGVNISIPRKVVEKKWSMDTRLLKEELTRIPIWVKLHDVPIQVFEEDGISLIATFIGKPVMLDSCTSSINEEEDSVDGVGPHTVSSSLDVYRTLASQTSNFDKRYAEIWCNELLLHKPSNLPILPKSLIPNAPAATTKHPLLQQIDIKLAFTGHAVLTRGYGRTDCSHKNRMRKIGEMIVMRIGA